MAQALDLADITNTVGAPSFAHFAKGGSRRCLRDGVRSCCLRAERNLPPALIHSHRPSFVQQVRTITAPPPFLRRTRQSPLHRIPVRIPQLLHPFLLRPHVEVIETSLPERRVQNRIVQ